MKILFLSLLLYPFFLFANESDDLYKLLEIKMSDLLLKDKSIVQGKQRARLCKYCHGKDGNSKRDYIPNLASQSPRYLLHQFELFASKQRKDMVMSELAKNLTADDRVNIALYYSTQKVHSRSKFKVALIAAGKKIYKARCHQCHGDNATGSDLVPHIASQPERYLRDTLIRYRSNSAWRPVSSMQTIAADLNNHDIDVLSAYLSSL